MVKTFMTIAGLVLCVAGGVQAQDRVQVQGTTPDLYVLHTVKKGETLYSLGRSYSLSPKEIASGNNISFEQGLQLGQSIKIPLSNTNFSQKSDAGGTPVYHRVEEKETLYRLSVNHNKVPLDNIRRWNNMSGDGLQKDSYVIVGYLKGSGIPASAPIASNPSPAPAPATQPPVTTSPVATPAPSTPAPTAPVVTTPPANNPATPVNKPDQQAPPEPVKAPETNTGGPKATPAAGASFEQLYNQQTTNGKNVTAEKGPGGWFKSNASPGKYYALHNSAPRGTIIKVTNPLNGKFIYAKVLESIPQIKQNEGLIIKLSDSALEALGTNEAKFYCQLNYED
ncbi:LysM peptidoglycan-binding domain-containing protein [Chitinophaga rhizophila]|uniref:LysM peptidoglycan-binding domain-containing protein n=1 Tax=Chitinophaga rhizophila TaxID=2866212 RepID=A0ABS7GD24_9BACT|nr:LysM peptidoglycan-binding domain-containing protein [Chitinophaga rhizophila]MBW8685055.1 LysM peptidoglycan-binding domain-containing protein [Chitinophaga rhizophila]